MGRQQVQAPFPWFGGKRRVASVVWDRFGPVRQYVEPFFGSGAMLLGRPGWREGNGWVETVNDRNGYVANVWRAIAADPKTVTEYAEWPPNENDLHARHSWLVGQKDALVSHLEGDPAWYDAKIAGWWLWGIALWIGSGWCSADGGWQPVNAGTDEEPEWQLLSLSSSGMGVRRQRPHLGNAGMGVHRQLLHLSDTGRGVHRQLLHLSEWMTALSTRMRYVRVCSGDWARVCTDGAMMNLPGPTAVFFDPPYSVEAERDKDLYMVDDPAVAHDVRQWCVEHSDNPLLRIALCGYRGEGHEELEALGWDRYDWSSGGGLGNTAAQPNGNRYREAIWFSPGCLGRVQRRLL